MPLRNDQCYLDAVAIPLPPYSKNLTQIASDAATITGKIPAVHPEPNHLTTDRNRATCRRALSSQLNCFARSSPAALKRDRRSPSRRIRRNADAHAAASFDGA